MSTPLEKLDDYVRGVPVDDGYEEDLFARALDGDAPELAHFDSLVATLRLMGTRGTLRNLVGSREAARLRDQWGDRAQYVAVTDGYEQHISVARDAEVVITFVSLDLRDVERVDVESYVDGYGLVKTFPDVTFEPGADGLYMCCEGTLARKVAGVTVVTKYVGVRNGERTLLRETRTETSLASV